MVREDFPGLAPIILPLPLEAGDTEGSCVDSFWPIHQLLINSNAIDAAKTNRLRLEDRGWRIEDGGWKVEDWGMTSTPSLSILDPRSSIFDSENTGHGCGISERKNERNSSSTSSFGFRISDFGFCLSIMGLHELPGPSGARPAAGVLGSSACARP